MYDSAGQFQLSKTLRLYGGFYAGIFGILALLGPYLPIFLDAKGFSAADIGFIIGATCTTKLIAPSFWGIISDRTGKRIQLIQISMLLAFISLIPLCWDLSLYQVIGTLFTFNFFLDAALPLFEANTLISLGAHSRYYGIIRGIGTLGYITALLTLPLIVDTFGIVSLPFILLIFIVIILILSRYIPSTTKTVPVVNQAPGFLAFFKKRTAWMFFLTALLFHASFVPTTIFFSIYCQDLGFSMLTIGILFAIGPLLEIPVFIGLNRLLTLFSPFGLAALGFTFLGFRFGAIPFVDGNFFGLIVIMSFHAICYAPVHGAMIFWAKNHFGDTHAGKAQGLYTGISIGIGSPLVALLAGYLWDTAGKDSIFYLSSILSFLGLTIIAIEALSQRIERRQ